MFDLLHKNIAGHIVLTEEELMQFCNLFEPVTVKKKQVLLQEGEICKFEGFVTSGLLKIYNLDSNGFEQILQFAMEGWWITDIDSFTNQRPSQLTIESLSDGQVLMISKENKDYAYKHIPKIEKLFRIMTQKTHVVMQRRMIDALGKTADIRYQDFIERYPVLANKLTNLQIAAYLGISHEFLSKIRKKASKN